MPSISLQHVRRASVLCSAVLLLCFPALANATTFQQIGRWFPSLAERVQGDPLLPSRLDVADDDGVANADATVDGSGLFVVTPRGSLRDAEGKIIDPDPRLVPAVGGLRPLTGGDMEDVRLPSGRDHWLELGSGVRVRLIGRLASKAALRPGAALYANALTGTDQLFLLDPDSMQIEELLIVSARSARRGATYQVALPAHWTLDTIRKDGARAIVIRDRRGKVRFTINAPAAIDAAGTQHRVALRQVGEDQFSLSVRPKRGVRVRGVLAIDPLYTKAINTVYPLGDGGKPYYTGDVCGNLADIETDFPGWDGDPNSWITQNPWAENGAPNNNANPFNPCSVPNEGPLVEFSPNVGPQDDFAAGRGTGDEQGNGVTVATRGEVDPNKSAWARINAPDNVGVWESEFRGHLAGYGSVGDPDITCELHVGPRKLNGQLSAVPASLVMPYWDKDANAPVGRPAASNANEYFFGGYPYGSDGGGAWAQFPFPNHPSKDIGAGYRWPDEVPFDADQNTHMFGRFSMDPNSVGQAAQDLWNMPRWVEMRLIVNNKITGGEHRCSADGRWRVVFRDAVNPVAQAPSAIAPGWHSDSEVAAANTQKNHPWRLAAASDVQGSGVKIMESLVSRAANTNKDAFVFADDPQIGENVCRTGETETQEVKVSAGAQPCSVADAWLINFALGQAGTDNPLTPAAPAFQAQAGAHKFRWRATDFANRQDLSPVSDLQDAPTTTDVGWYWVDAKPPSCKMTQPYVTGGKANFRIEGYESQYTYPSGLRLGSGVARIQVYKVARGSTFDYANPSGVLVYEYRPDLGTLHSGDKSVPVDLSIPLSVAEQEGDFKLYAIVTDGVGKRSYEAGAEVNNCNVTPVVPNDCTGANLGALHLYRGASGVLARWTNPTIVPPGSTGRVETYWSATITHTDGTVEVRGGVIRGGEWVGRDGEVYIDAPPASQVDIKIEGQCTPYQGQTQRTSTLSDTEFVDARPTVDVGSPFTAVDTRPGASKFRSDGGYDPVYEKLHVAISDPNGLTQQRSGTDYAQGATTQRTLNADASSDRARVIVRLTPDRASSRAADTDPEVPGAETYLVWEIGSAADGTPHRFWLADGPLAADAYTRSFASLPADVTCTAGNGRIDTMYWSLDCAASVPTVSAGAAGDRGTRGFDVDLDLTPRDNAVHALAGTAERFPTPDRNYHVAAAVRDQRQEADQRFLHHDASLAADEQISRANAPGVGTDAPPGFDQVGTLIVDRERPTAELSVEARHGDQSVTIENVLHVRLGYVLAAKDARDVNPAVAGDASPSRVSWTGFGQVWFEQPPAPPGFTMQQSGGAAPCDKPLPLYTVTPGSGTRCERTYSSTMSTYAVGDDDQRLLSVKAHVVDIARNETVLTDDVYVDRVDPVVEPVAIKGASGVAAAWPNPTDMSPPLAHQWRCDAPGSSAANPDAAVPDPGWSAAFAAERAGWTSSGICPGRPGEDVTVWIRVTDAVGNITVTSVHRRVDQRPVISEVGGYSDPATWNDSWDDPRWDLLTSTRPDRRNDDLVMTIGDPDDIIGISSVNDDRVADSIAVTTPVSGGDRSLFVIHVDDASSPEDAFLVIQPRSIDTDSSYENAAASGQLEGATAWLVDDLSEIDETAKVPVASDGCELESNGPPLTTDWWEFDCSRFAASLVADTSADPYGTKLGLVLPLRARDNRTINGPFPTPDDRYPTRAWVRDQRQLADNAYLVHSTSAPGNGSVNARAFVTDPTAMPDADNWRGVGTIQTDRIDPTITYNHAAWKWWPGEQVTFRLDAHDPAPPLAQRTLTRVASGVRFVTNVQAQYEVGALGSNVWANLPTDPSCDTSGCDVHVTIYESVYRARLRLHATVVDNAWNYTEYNADEFMPPPPPSDCEDNLGQYPHVEFASGNGSNANSKIDSDGDGVDDIDFAPSNLHIQCLGQPTDPPDDTDCLGGVPRYPFHGEYGFQSVPAPDFTAYALTDGNKRLPCIGEFHLTRKIPMDLDGDGAPDDAIETVTRFIGNTKADGTGDPVVIRTRHVMREPGNPSNPESGFLEHSFWYGPLPIADTDPPDVEYDTDFDDGYQFQFMK